MTNYVTKDSGKREEYSSGMVRDTQDAKPRYDLIHEPMLTRWAELMDRGARKYGESNWMLANSEEEATRFRASAWRHFVQWARGDRDEDHAAAVLFNVAAYEYVARKVRQYEFLAETTDEPTPEELASIKRGLEDARAGRVRTLKLTEEAKPRIDARHPAYLNEVTQMGEEGE